jgi:hypothetical protein
MTAFNLPAQSNPDISASIPRAGPVEPRTDSPDALGTTGHGADPAKAYCPRYDPAFRNIFLDNYP